MDWESLTEDNRQVAAAQMYPLLSFFSSWFLRLQMRGFSAGASLSTEPTPPDVTVGRR